MVLFVCANVGLAQQNGNIEELGERIRILEEKLEKYENNSSVFVKNGTDNVDSLDILDISTIETQDISVLSRNKQVNALIEMMQDEERGQIQFKGSSTTILQAGRHDKIWHSTATSSFDIFAIATFNQYSMLFFDLEAITGNGPDAYFHNYSGLNGDAGSTLSEDGVNRLNLLEAWAEFSIFKSKLKLITGKIDLTNYFDNNTSANDETVQFISNAFINNTSFAVPSNAPGALVRGVLFDRIFLQYAMSKIQNTGDEIFSELYKIASIGYKFLPGSDFETNLRFYAYQHPETGNSAGWGISFDDVVFGKFNIFGRYGENQTEIANLWGVNRAWSAGARFVHKVKDNPVVLGAAYGETNFVNCDYAPEHIVEVYARRQLNRWAHVSPHFQMIWGGSCFERTYVYGFRTHFNF